jgi:glycosyltransferase involved in cell wall biosynthesis
MAVNSKNGVPKVSIVMPSYNTAQLIAASLDSVLVQSFQDFEILVVNDGSPDTVELERVLSSYMERIVYIKQENKRAAGARNTAIRRARGEFLAFLDSDDIWFPGHLASQLKLFDEDPSLDLVYSNCYSWGDPERKEAFMERCPSHGPARFETLVVERCQIPVSTVVVRKSVLEKAGLFDENLLRCDDYDMWLRAAFHGAKIAYTQKIQARLNDRRPGSLGVSSEKMQEAYWIILEKLHRELPLSDSQRTCVRERSAQIRARFLIEQAKTKLDAGQFDKAKELFAEANAYLRSSVLSLTEFSLGVAPTTARRLINVARKIRRKVKPRPRQEQHTSATHDKGR